MEMKNGWTCSACGADARLTRGSYAYKESGLDHITLEGIQLVHCDACGNEDPIIPAIDTLHAILAEALISKPARLEGKELRFLRKELGLSARQFAKILHVDHTTISKWENGNDPIGPQSDLLVRALLTAKKEGSLDPLVAKLSGMDEDLSALDITVNTETNQYEYA